MTNPKYIKQYLPTLLDTLQNAIDALETASENLVSDELTQFIPVSQFVCDSAHTWSYSGAGDVPGLYYEATGTVPIYIPIVLPTSLIENQGSKLKAIDIYYTVDTAALTAVAEPVLHKNTLGENGVGISAADVDITLDDDHDDAAERIATGDHRMTVILDEEEFLETDEYFVLELSFVGSASSELFVQGAQVHYEAWTSPEEIEEEEPEAPAPA